MEITAQHLNMFKAMYADGVSVREIAATVGCVHSTVRYHLKRLGVPLRGSHPHPKHTIKELTQIYKKNGRNSKKTAIEIGSNAGNIRTRLKKAGIKTRTQSEANKESQRRPESRQRQTENAIRQIKKQPWSTGYPSTKKGWRTIDGQKHYFRSAWEANYARLLGRWREEGLILKWEFEPQVFWFEKIRRGTRSYLPDFRLTMPDNQIKYVEMKGYMNSKSKTKLNRMRIYHPEVVLELVDSPKYKEIEKQYKSLIKDWE